MGYFKEDPFGDHRADVRNAQLLQLLYNINAGKKASKKTLTDWMPFYRKKVTVDEDISTSIRNRFATLIGKDSDG